MELRHLRYFLAVAEERNVTRAAERLGIQQPPLSQQINALEAELGTRLLRRLPRGVELTASGRTFLRDARAILADLDVAAGRAARVAQGSEGSLVVGATTSAAAHGLTPSLFQAFRTAWPAVHLEHREGTAARLTEGVVDGSIEVALLRAPVAYPPDLVFDHLLDEKMLAVIPAGHRLAGMQRAKPFVNLNALRDEGFILVRRPGAPGMYADFLAACAKAGFTPRIVAEVDGMLTNISLVAAGIGISVVPESMRGFHSEAVVYRELRSQPRLLAPMTLVHRSAVANPAAAHLIALAKKLARRG